MAWTDELILVREELHLALEVLANRRQHDPAPCVAVDPFPANEHFLFVDDCPFGVLELRLYQHRFLFVQVLDLAQVGDPLRILIPVFVLGASGFSTKHGACRHGGSGQRTGS